MAKKTATKTPAAAKKKAVKKKTPILARPATIPSTAGSLASAATAPASAGSAAAYAQYLPIAEATPAAQIPSFRLNPSIAYQNVSTAMAALAPYSSTLAKLPAPFSLAAMQSVPDIALATVYATAQIDLSSPGTTKVLVSKATALRTLLMSSAVALMNAGTLPAPSVKRIVKGVGPRNIAQDCVDLAQLFTANAALVQGKTPVTAAQLAQASSIGNQLLTVLKPKGTPTTSRSALPTVAARDALGALLTAQYEQQVRRAAMWIWVDAVDQHVPPLASHTVHKKKAAAPAKPVSAAPAGAVAKAP